jgi:hypothetical protein
MDSMIFPSSMVGYGCLFERVKMESKCFFKGCFFRELGGIVLQAGRGVKSKIGGMSMVDKNGPG